MSNVKACRLDSEWRQLIADQMSSADAEEAARHLEVCEQCAATVDQLLTADTLAELARQHGVVDTRIDSQAKSLAERLRGLAAEQRTVNPPADANAATVAPRESAAHAHETQTESPGQAEAWDFLAPPQSADEIGRLGQYRILQVLGHGGMGVVFRAEDPALERIVAIKAMLPALAASPSAKKRFLREAKTAASIKHDHIVTIFQVAEDRGAPFLAMEFLHGEALDERLKREGRLPIPEVLRIGREVAEGLAAAHDEKLIHRDIKPANVWLESKSHKGELGASATGGRVKILDFGLARATDDQAGLTKAGAIMGTPSYMAPEQARGDVVDHRCDLFSLGCMLYAMTIGELPFKGKDTISTLMAVSMHDPTPPWQVCADVPQDLSDYIMKLLAKEAADRPASAHDVSATLGAMANARMISAPKLSEPSLISGIGQPSMPSLTSRGTDARCPSRTQRVILATVMLGILAAAVAGMVLFLQTPDGILRVEINDPKIEVRLTDGKLLFEKGSIGPKVIAVTPGLNQLLHIKMGELDFKTDLFILNKGDDITLRVTWFSSGKIEVSKNGEVIQTETAKVAAKASDTPAPGDLDRSVAQWALKSGVQRIRIETNNNKEAWIIPGETLPEQPFHLVALDFEITTLQSAHLASLRDLPHLHELTFSPARLRNDDLKDLNPNLTFLGLKHDTSRRIDDEALMHVGRLSKLENLMLFQMPEITGAGLKHLAKLQNLERLTLDDTKVTDQGLEHLAGLKRLRFLGLGAGVTGAGLKHLVHLPITVIFWSPTSIDPSAFEHLATMKKLESLRVGGPTKDSDLLQLKSLKPLINLHLIDSKVTADGLRKLKIHFPKLNFHADPAIKEKKGDADNSVRHSF